MKQKNDEKIKLKKDVILKLTNVSKKFGDFEALSGISFELKKGERIGLIGGNGVGKTTLSEIISGIAKQTSGEIEYGFEYKTSPKEGIGMQFQQSTYPSGLTVKDIISFAINLRKLEFKKDELKRLLKIFQMESLYNRRVRNLSGGQSQKLNILLSILHKPRIVILDELSTGLDISARENILSFTDKLLKDNDISAIFISHHMEEIKEMCNKVILLDEGKIVEIISVVDIEKKHGSINAYAKKMIGINKNNELVDKKTLKTKKKGRK